MDTSGVSVGQPSWLDISGTTNNDNEYDTAHNTTQADCA